MEVIESKINGVKVLHPQMFEDDRGAFCETYNKRALAEAGINTEFVQDNYCRNPCKGTVRGLHFQTSPHAQAKLIWVVRGTVQDVVVDLRHGSPTFGEHECFNLSAENLRQVFIPAGLAHGYCTLEADTEVAYKVDAFYAPEHEGGLLWSDTGLEIDWPVSAGEATVSERDRGFPRFDELPKIFQWA